MKSIHALELLIGFRPRGLPAWLSLVLLMLGLPLQAANVTFYVANSASLNASDNNVKITLEMGLGHTVILRNCASSTVADTAGQALIVISSTCAGDADIGSKFTDVRIPMLTWESAIYDDLKMTGATPGTHFGTTTSVTSINMVPANSGHTLAGGITGSPTIYATPNIVNWGQATGAGAFSIATTSDATHSVIFGYDVGGSMVGMTAPGRRIGFFLGDNPALTSTGNTLLQAALKTALPPKINLNPVSQTIVTGQTATFTVFAQGQSPLTYQWRKNGVNIAGATNSSYTTSATVAGDNGAAFSCVISNGFGTATSGNATLTLNSSAAVITAQPANAAITEYQTATFNVTASGTGLSYKWFKNGVEIVGATASSYTTPASPPADNGTLYSAMISKTGVTGSILSANATLTVNFNAKISQQPAATTVSEGKMATFCVVFTANPTATIQWRKNGNNIGGATGYCYTTPPVSASDDGAQYSVVIVNSMGSVSSNNAKLTVIPPWTFIDTLKAVKVIADTIVANVLVTTPKWKIPDYVFEPGYKVRSLGETEAYIRAHRHLPEVPSAADIEKNGMSVGEMNVKLLKTVEEMTLHLIELDKEMKAMKAGRKSPE